MAPSSLIVLITESGSLSDEDLKSRRDFEDSFTSRGVKFAVLEERGARVVVVSADFEKIAKVAEEIKIFMPTTAHNYTYEVRLNKI